MSGISRSMSTTSNERRSSASSASRPVLTVFDAMPPHFQQADSDLLIDHPVVGHEDVARDDLRGHRVVARPACSLPTPGPAAMASVNSADLAGLVRNCAAASLAEVRRDARLAGRHEQDDRTSPHGGDRPRELLGERPAVNAGHVGVDDRHADGSARVGGAVHLGQGVGRVAAGNDAHPVVRQHFFVDQPAARVVVHQQNGQVAEFGR